MNGRRRLARMGGVMLILSVMFALAAGLTRAQSAEGIVSAEATTGTAFTYQGRLTDDGSPADGEYDFEFKLYDDADNQVGSTVTVADKLVTDGVFTVEVDFGSGAFNGEARFLEIGVRVGSSDGDYTTLAPRQALTPAPYALALPGLWTRQTGNFGAVGGGSGNVVGAYGAIAGGYGNVISETALYAAVGGGYGNGVITNTALCAAIGGGQGNQVRGQEATVGGGRYNLADYKQATVAGGHVNRATALRATVGGGYSNEATANEATVSGGHDNTAGGIQSTVGGGRENSASNGYATVCGGYNNNVSGSRGTVAGGEQNEAGGYLSTIGGGFDNDAGNRSTVGGGVHNSASGTWATVPGGLGNKADGDYSFAAGRSAKAIHEGTFVWADSTDGDLFSDGEDRFIVRASGGVLFFSSSDESTGVYLASGSEGWTAISASDRNLKENFTPVDQQEVLAGLAELEITTWNYKAADPGVRHMSPMSQDFHAAFGLGEDDKHLTALDTNGVALAAIQGLHQLSQDQAARIEALEAENAAQQKQLDALEARVAALEATSARRGRPLRSSLLPGAGVLLLALGGLWVAGRVGVLEPREGGRR